MGLEQRRLQLLGRQSLNRTIPGETETLASMDAKGRAERNKNFEGRSRVYRYIGLHGWFERSRLKGNVAAWSSKDLRTTFRIIGLFGVVLGFGLWVLGFGATYMGPGCGIEQSSTCSTFQFQFFVTYTAFPILIVVISAISIAYSFRMKPASSI